MAGPATQGAAGPQPGSEGCPGYSCHARSCRSMPPRPGDVSTASPAGAAPSTPRPPTGVRNEGNRPGVGGWLFNHALWYPPSTPALVWAWVARAQPRPHLAERKVGAQSPPPGLPQELIAGRPGATAGPTQRGMRIGPAPGADLTPATGQEEPPPLQGRGGGSPSGSAGGCRPTVPVLANRAGAGGVRPPGALRYPGAPQLCAHLGRLPGGRQPYEERRPGAKGASSRRRSHLFDRPRATQGRLQVR